MKIVENEVFKICVSPDYNYRFNKKTGEFIRSGKTTKTEDDPTYSPFGPEIADIEVTTKCSGIDGKVCPFCYKSNTPEGKNMPLETFKKMFHKFPKTLTQIAFGADSHATSNPDLFAMMDYCRNNSYNEVIPNITVAQITDETADKLVSVCGAVAVSRYANKNVCYDTVKRLTDRGLIQTNIHCMISEETFDQAWETLQDRLTDERLSKLRAIVFLSLKKKGRGVNFTPLSQDKFKQIVDFSMKNNIGIGFDSCSAYKYLQCVKNHPQFELFQSFSEPCESSAFSTYCNVDAHFFPCSFSEGHGEWVDGLDVANCNDFIKDIWLNEKTKKFRDGLLTTANGNELKCRECPLFEI